jgi:DNA-binding GntR family transcriptional regulator
MEEEESLAFNKDELKSLTEAAYEKIKQAIVAGSFSPGSRLSERDLSERMKVSTTTVKRALGRLCVEGLVEISPRRGTFVAESFGASMKENAMIRASLEGLAARFAAEKAEAPDLEALSVQLEIMRLATEEGLPEKMVEANTLFHHLLHETAKNPYIKRLIEVLRLFDMKVRGRALSDPEEARRGLREHTRVFAAVRARDGELADRLMREHILRTLDFVLSGDHPTA